jgi:cysteine desulfurase / selenocysteine lyase
MSTPDQGLDFDALGREIARLANEHFAGSLGAPPNPGPSAAAPGAGGVSPSVGLPPVPGALQTPPLANAPLPRESELRTAPNTLAQGVGLPPPVLAAAPVTPPDATPYFLSVAGLPASIPAEAPGAPPAPNASNALPYSSSSAEPAWLATDFGATAFHPELAPSVTLAPSRGTIFDSHAIRRDFPILEERVHGGKRLVWLDNGATTQKPRAVIERLTRFYEHENSNIHRAAHVLAARATDAYEGARESTRRFLNAPSAKNVVFVRGGTEAINLVAKTWGKKNIGPGDEIVITWLEHHANIVPWQQLAHETGAVLRVVPVDDDGQVVLEAYERLLGPKTRFVSITHVSNALGTVVPVRTMTEMAHRYGARVLIDGAQAVSHLAVDVQALDCDFYCFSGHKVFAPTGIGALYGKSDVLETMPPWQGGGNMIEDVTFEKTRYQPAPARFEAGTGSIADAAGLGAALDYVSAIGLENIGRYEHELLVYATERLLKVPGLRLFGTAPDKAGVLSFVLDGHRAEDVGAALDREGIAVRAGHHCAQPILRRFGLESTVRASLALYNTCEDIDALVATLHALTASSYFRGR